jgi:anti-sigma factor RsiW
MNHKKIRELISAFADGELGPRDQQTATSHLEQCNECRVFLEQLRQASLAIREAGDFRLPEGFTYDILRSARREREESSQWLPVEQIARRFVLGLTIAVIVFVSLSMIMRPSEPVIMEPYLSGEQADSSVTRTLLTKENLSTDDVLIAAVTRK